MKQTFFSDVLPSFLLSSLLPGSPCLWLKGGEGGGVDEREGESLEPFPTSMEFRRSPDLMFPL